MCQMFDTRVCCRVICFTKSSLIPVVCSSLCSIVSLQKPGGGAAEAQVPWSAADAAGNRKMSWLGSLLPWVAWQSRCAGSWGE